MNLTGMSKEDKKEHLLDWIRNLDESGMDALLLDYLDALLLDYLDANYFDDEEIENLENDLR